YLITSHTDTPDQTGLKLSKNDQNLNRDSLTLFLRNQIKNNHLIPLPKKLHNYRPLITDRSVLQTSRDPSIPESHRPWRGTHYCNIPSLFYLGCCAEQPKDPHPSILERSTTSTLQIISCNS